MSQVHVHPINCGRWFSSACTCGIDVQEGQPHPELTSLREIKDKLDLALAMLNDRKGQDKKRDEQFAALAESQGKLLARLDALDAGLHETAMRNHQQIRAVLEEIRSSGPAWTQGFTTAQKQINEEVAKELREVRGMATKKLDLILERSSTLECVGRALDSLSETIASLPYRKMPRKAINAKARRKACQ